MKRWLVVTSEFLVKLTWNRDTEGRTKRFLILVLNLRLTFLYFVQLSLFSFTKTHFNILNESKQQQLETTYCPNLFSRFSWQKKAMNSVKMTDGHYQKKLLRKRPSFVLPNETLYFDKWNLSRLYLAVICERLFYWKSKDAYWKGNYLLAVKKRKIWTHTTC